MKRTLFILVSIAFLLCSSKSYAADLKYAKSDEKQIYFIINDDLLYLITKEAVESKDLLKTENLKAYLAINKNVECVNPKSGRKFTNVLAKGDLFYVHIDNIGTLIYRLQRADKEGIDYVRLDYVQELKTFE